MLKKTSPIPGRDVANKDPSPISSISTSSDMSDDRREAKRGSAPRRDERHVSLCRYIDAYHKRYYHRQPAKKRLTTAKRLRLKKRRKWDAIISLLRKAVVIGTPRYPRYKPRPVAWFLLYKSTPPCPLKRFAKKSHVRPTSKIHEDRLSAILDVYFRMRAVSIKDDRSLPDLQDLFEIRPPCKPPTRVTESYFIECQQMATDHNDRYTQELLRDAENITIKAIRFWKREAKYQMSQTARPIYHDEIRFYEDVLTVNGKLQLPPRTRNVASQTCKVLEMGISRWTHIDIWRGFFPMEQSPLYNEEDDKEIKTVKFRRIPMPKITCRGYDITL